MLHKIFLVFVTTLFVSGQSQVQKSKSDINYENIRRFKQQSPENLAKTLELLENPYIATALVQSNKTPDFAATNQGPATTTTPKEESNNLLNFLLSQRQSNGPRYDVKKPPISLVPPSVNTRGILDDPLLGSFFQNTREDLPPLENAKNIDVPLSQASATSYEQIRAVEITTAAPSLQNTYYFYNPFSYFSYS